MKIPASSFLCRCFLIALVLLPFKSQCSISTDLLNDVNVDGRSNQRASLSQSKGVTVALSPTDRLLILTSSKTFHGSLTKGGFISLFTDEVRKISPTIEVMTLQWSICNPLHLVDEEKIEILRSVLPTKILILIENNFSECFSENASFSLHQFREHLEIFLLKFLRPSLTATLTGQTRDDEEDNSIKHILLAPLCIVGDCGEFHNGEDMFFEDLLQLLLLFPRFYEEVSILDLTVPISKFLELAEDILTSMRSATLLTYDGSHLNPLGHKILSLELLRALLPQNKVSFEHIRTEIAKELQELKHYSVESESFESEL